MELGKGSKKRFSDINMTPFVDVVLVLLIIFMIAAPMLEQGININLPQAKGTTIEKPDEPVVITLKNDQLIYINEQQINSAALDERISLMFRNRTNKSVFIKADEKLPYGFVAKIISKIKEGGVEKIGLVTVPPQEQTK